MAGMNGFGGGGKPSRQMKGGEAPKKAGIDDRMGALMEKVDSLAASGDPAADDVMKEFDSIDAELGSLMARIDALEKRVGGGTDGEGGGEGGGEGAPSDDEISGMLAEITGKGAPPKKA